MLWLVFLFIVILVLAVIVALYVLSPYRLQNYNIVVKPEVQLQQRLLFETVTQHLNAANIPYWAVRETLVDIVEHKVLSKNRDVLNIAVLREFERQLMHLKPNQGAKVPFVLQRVSDGYMCYINDVGDFPCLHISVMEQRQHEVLPCTSHNEFEDFTHRDNHNLRAEIYLVREVFPLREVTVQNISINIPQNAQACATLFKNHTSSHTPSIAKLIYNQRTKNIGANLSTAIYT